MWKGCIWVYKGGGGYTLSARMTNLTVDMIRDRHFPDEALFTVGTRRAVVARQIEGTDTCMVNVDLRGGSIEFKVLNPPSGRDTGHLDSCELTRTLTEKIAPSIPTSL